MFIVIVTKAAPLVPLYLRGLNRVIARARSHGGQHPAIPCKSKDGDVNIMGKGRLKSGKVCSL